MRGNVKTALLVVAGAAIVVLGIGFQVHINNQCGWDRAALWGKGVNTLYFMGYCND